MKNLSVSSDTASVQEGRFGPISALLVTLLSFFGAQFIAGLLLAYPYSLITHRELNESLFADLNNLVAGQIIYIFLFELCTLAIIYWFINYRKITLAEIGFGRRPKLSDLGNALLFAVGYFFVTIVIVGLVQRFVPYINVNQEQQVGFESASGPLQLALVFVALAILVPITEETLVRGFLYSGLRRKLTRVMSALIASVIFGIAHLQLGSGAPPLYIVAIDTFILSLFLIALREKTGSLWSGIAVHTLKNSIAFLSIFVFHVS